MALQLKIYEINQKNRFDVFYKESESPFPLNEEFIFYGTFDSSVNEITLSGQTFSFNSKYWIKLVDTKTNKYIVKSIYTNDPIAFENCGASCSLDGLSRLLYNNTEYISAFIKLTVAGIDTGPFDILYSNDNGLTFHNITINQQKENLILGITELNNYNLTLDSIIRIKSTGVCKNFIDTTPTLMIINEQID